MTQIHGLNLVNGHFTNPWDGGGGWVAPGGAGSVLAGAPLGAQAFGSGLAFTSPWDASGDFTQPGAAAPVSAAALLAPRVSAGGFSFNMATGQDASGNIQTAGDLADAHWSVTGADSYKNSPIAYTVAPGDGDWYGQWPTNGPGSSWIAANPQTNVNGNVTYTLTFDLTGYKPADAALVGGEFMLDDGGTVSLNGHVLASVGFDGWRGGFTALSNAAGDFVAGVNTLVIQTTGSDHNYEAARFEGAVVDTATTTPGPVHWANPVSGDFATPADWSGGFVPGASNDAILDAAGITLYTVTSSASETINSIQTAANATLAVTGGDFVATSGTGGGVNAGVISVSNSATLTLGGTVGNAGSIVVVGGTQGTALIFGTGGGLNAGGSATLTGGGAVTFLPNSGYNFSGLLGGVLTNIDNTISGDFQVELTGLVNDSAGVIDAIAPINAAAPRSNLFANTITNAGLIESTGPSPLFIVSDTLINSGGVILAGDGSSVEIVGGVLMGGALDTSGTGIVHVDGLTLDGTTEAVNNRGAMVVGGGLYTFQNANVVLDGTINNTGSISLSTLNHVTLVEVGAANAVLTGGGKVILGDDHASAITGYAPGATLTNVDNMISGAGRLGIYGNVGAAFFLVNEAAGVINANGAVGMVLDTGANTVTNAGLIEATGSGGLTIRGTTVDGSGGGVIAAGSGSHVGLQGATLIGGTLESTGTGTLRTFGIGNTLDGTTSTVNNEAVLIVAGGSGLTLQGTLNNTGKIALASRSAGATLTIGSAGATLTGGGRLLMDSSALNRIVGASPAATLTNIDNNLSGAGQIGAGSLTLVNGAKGVIVGSLSIALVIDTGANTITNAGIILSRGAGGVTIQSAVANSGVLEAAGGVLTVNGAVSGSGAGVIFAGTLDFTSSFSQKVVFRGPTGVLELAQSQSYAGTVFGFSKTGGTSLDLADIGFVSATEATFSGLASGGVLTVTDGTHTPHIALRGDYTASTFTASSDGHGGTLVVDAAAPAAAHRFVAAAASLGAGGGGALMGGHPAMRAHPLMLARPGVMIA